MQRETDEFRDIVEGEWKGGAIPGKRPSAEELTRALQTLLVRQCLYSHTPGIGRAYEIVRSYPTFFARYFGALGYELTVSARDQMVALVVPAAGPRYDATYERLRKDETLVLLALRLLWEEGVREHQVGEAGIVETTTGELVDRISALAGQAPPEENRLADILRLFQRQGAVRVGARDPVRRVAQVAILPGVSVLVPDAYVEDILLWAASPGAREEPREGGRPDGPNGGPKGGPGSGPGSGAEDGPAADG